MQMMSEKTMKKKQIVIEKFCEICESKTNYSCHFCGKDYCTEHRITHAGRFNISTFASNEITVCNECVVLKKDNKEMQILLEIKAYRDKYQAFRTEMLRKENILMEKAHKTNSNLFWM
jgi:Zn-finger protein